MEVYSDGNAAPRRSPRTNYEGRFRRMTGSTSCCCFARGRRRLLYRLFGDGSEAVMMETCSFHRPKRWDGLAEEPCRSLL